ncbi:MAG: nucleoside deaminase [Gammaproteobacteria bacterium]|nr:nucleoside deaminase [Gammaproteobacteria bacterium]
MTEWGQLDTCWRHAMSAALEAYLDGSAPIGAVVVDSNGQIISTGRNNFAGDRLGHAEMGALNGVPANTRRDQISLFSTLEPCPMCTGAVRMMQIKSLHFAARDPAAGSIELLTATRFMRRFSCDVKRPADPTLEFVNVALTLEYRTRIGHLRWRDEWISYNRPAVEVGEKLAEEHRFSHWTTANSTPETIFEEVCGYVR